VSFKPIQSKAITTVYYTKIFKLENWVFLTGIFSAFSTTGVVSVRSTLASSGLPSVSLEEIIIVVVCTEASVGLRSQYLL
jgi:hypothetical protein